MSELVRLIITHDFMLGVGVGVAFCWIFCLTSVVWMCTYVERSEG